MAVLLGPAAGHPVKIDPASQLGELPGKVKAVNGLHHQGTKDLAPGLVAMAWSPDGLVEAVEVARKLRQQAVVA